MKAMRELSFEYEVCRVLAEVYELLLAKRHDYGKANIEKHGESGILVRLDDKLARLAHLQGAAETQASESIDDTWLDIAGYAVLALLLRRGKF